MREVLPQDGRCLFRARLVNMVGRRTTLPNYKDIMQVFARDSCGLAAEAARDWLIKTAKIAESGQEPT